MTRPLHTDAAAPAGMPSVSADYFDGHSARAHPVTLTLVGDRLDLSGDGIARSERLADLRVSEPMGSAPRLLRFADGAHCAVRDHAGLDVLLAAAGHRDTWVVRLQARWHWAVAALLVSVASVVAAYLWGLPALAGALASVTPDSVVRQLGRHSLATLDEAVLAPSSLDAARQQALIRRFADLAPPGETRPGYRILFRDGRRVGANALALPDGTLIVTDQLVKLADDDAQIMAVLAHELGHVRHRHGLRLLIQTSVVGLVMAWYIGDVSSLAAGLPTLLLQAGYSRAHEREADRYAAELLRHNGLSPHLLADMLDKLEAAHGDGELRGLGYLSSHPANRERVAHLRSGG